MSDTPQLPAKRLKSEDVVVASSSPAHMSHGSSYLTPTQFQHAYSAYTSAPPPPPPYNHSQPSYSYQPLQLLQPEQTHHYHPLSLPSYHGTPLSSSLSRKRPASEMDTPPMGGNVGLSSMSYSSGQGSSLLHGGPSHSNTSQLEHGGMMLPGQGGEPPRLGLHLGPGAVQDVVPGAGMQGPKKGRTNTPWTREEEMRLKHMRDAGNSWSEIAKEFPNRTEGSVKKHWYKDMHYTEISEDEGSFKAALISAIKEYDSNKWKIIGQKMGKPAKACEQFAREHLGKT